MINPKNLWAESLSSASSDFPFDPNGTDDEPVASIDQAIIWLMVAGIIWFFLFLRNTLRKQTITK